MPERAELQTRYIAALIDILEGMPNDLGMTDEAEALCNRIERLLGYDVVLVNVATSNTAATETGAPARRDPEPVAERHAERPVPPPVPKPRSSAGMLCGGTRGRHTYSYPPLAEGGRNRCEHCGAEQPKGPGHPIPLTTPAEAEAWQRRISRDQGEPGRADRLAAEFEQRIAESKRTSPEANDRTFAGALEERAAAFAEEVGEELVNGDPDAPDPVGLLAATDLEAVADEAEAQAMMLDAEPGSGFKPSDEEPKPDPGYTAVPRVLEPMAEALAAVLSRELGSTAAYSTPRAAALTALLASWDVEADSDDERELAKQIARISRFCWLCGCTEDNACEEGCDWANEEKIVCTACVAKEAARAEV